MSDTTTAPAATPEAQAADGQHEQEQPKTPLSAEELAAALKKTREEAADYRRKLREAEAKNEAADKARADAEAASLAEQGKYKELWEKAQADAQAAADKLQRMEHDQLRRDAAQAAGSSPLWYSLFYTSDAAEEEDSVRLVGGRVIKKKKNKQLRRQRHKHTTARRRSTTIRTAN